MLILDVAKVCIYLPPSKENFSSNVRVSENKKDKPEELVALIEERIEDMTIMDVKKEAKDPFEDLLSVFSNDLNSVVCSSSPCLDMFQPIEIQESNNDQLIIFDDTLSPISQEDNKAEEYPHVLDNTLYTLSLVKNTITFEELNTDADILDKIKSHKCIFTLNKTDRWVEYNKYLALPDFSLSGYLHSKFSNMMRYTKPRYDAPNSFYTINYNDDKLRFSKGTYNTGGLSFYFIEEGTGFKFVKNPAELKVISENSNKQNENTGKKEKMALHPSYPDMKKISTKLSDSEFENVKENDSVHFNIL
jgi:hypothetical protein